MRVDRTKISQSEKMLIIAVTVFVVAVFVLIWWWTGINQNPVVTIPAKVLPSPNAYDFFVKGAMAVQDTGVIPEGSEAIWVKPIPLTRPAAAVVPPGAPPSMVPPPTPSIPSLREMEAVVAKNAAALAEVRRGFAYDYYDPARRSLYTLFPHYSRFRNVARLLAIDAYAKSTRGDWDAGMSSVLDSLRMGVECPKGGPLLGCLVGIAIEAIGRESAWRMVDHLSADGARSAARRMEMIVNRRALYADTLEEEKYFGMGGLMELFHQPKWRTQGLRTFIGTDMPFQTMTCSKRELMRNYVTYMDASIARSRQPYAAHAPDPPMPKDSLSQCIIPVFSKARMKYVINETQDALLLTALALRAYRTEHGAYPAALAGLCPKYLAILPTDPFAMSGSLKYRRSGKSYVLYSVGPDGKDNGGTPSTDGRARQTNSSGRAITTTSNSTGDIVAGINMR